MDKKQRLLIVCLVFALCVFSPACKKKTQPGTTPDASAADQGIQTQEPVDTTPEVQVEEFEKPEVDTRPMDESAAAINSQGVLKTIYFGYDESDLSDTARAILRENANWLKANPRWNVVIQGHCDERGTIEYNLTLGQRRANAVRDYMASLGVPVARIRTVSFGEERPEDSGHTEAAWAKNRRGVFQVEDR